MKICSPSFKGRIIIPSSRMYRDLDTDKILKFEKKQDEVLIFYDIITTQRHNGVTYEGPTTIKTHVDFNTLINAYNAAKNSDIVIDLNA